MQRASSFCEKVLIGNMHSIYYRRSIRPNLAGLKYLLEIICLKAYEMKILTYTRNFGFLLCTVHCRCFHLLFASKWCDVNPAAGRGISSGKWNSHCSKQCRQHLLAFVSGDNYVRGKRWGIWMCWHVIVGSGEPCTHHWLILAYLLNPQINFNNIRILGYWMSYYRLCKKYAQWCQWGYRRMLRISWFHTQWSGFIQAGRPTLCRWLCPPLMRGPGSHVPQVRCADLRGWRCSSWNKSLGLI